jgi:hypothetical protein
MYFPSRLQNPVFIVGCGRSGTTLLADILSSHPAIAVFPNEANDLWHPDLYPWHRSKVEVPPIWIDPLNFTGYSLERLSWSKIRAVFSTFQFLTQRPVFLNKSVMLSFMLREIAQRFESARFIHMYRDGRAVALSYAKKNLPKIQQNLDKYASVGITDDRDALMFLSFDHWMAHLKAVETADREERLTASGRLLEFSYEEFSQDPEKYLAIVLEFMDLKGDIHSLAAQATIKNQNYKVFEELSASHLEHFLARGRSTLQRRGYAVA